MNKSFSSSDQDLGSFPSPGAPNYRDKGFSGQKGWSSERVPPPPSFSRRRASLGGLTPLNSLRAFPSKWDEAERWICSPASRNGITQVSLSQPHRRPKSKSGPIVPPPTVTYYPNYYSPTLPVLENLGTGMRSLMLGSPFSTGVLAADRVSVFRFGGDDGEGQPCPTHTTNNVVGYSGQMSQPEPSLLNSQDEKHEPSKIEEATGSVLHRDKATQMTSTESVPHSSSPGQSSCLSTSHPSLPSDADSRSCHSKTEVRDVQVDSRATCVRWSRRHGTKVTTKESCVKGSDKNHLEAQKSSWHIAEAATNISKLQREEKKITAWENLQQAKAEAAIRKLEMRLEKKRSASMERILNKLRKAQMKAHKMRSSISSQKAEADQVPKIISLPTGFHKRTLRSCFSCRTM